MRVSGGGRKHKLTSYEFAVLDYYDTCLREEGKASRKEVLDYCKTKPEFLLKEAGTQQVWVTRFIKRYKIGAYDEALVHLREDKGRMSHSSPSPVEAATSAAPTPVVTTASADDDHHETVISIDGVEQTTYGDAGGDGSASSGDSDAVTNTDAIARRTRTRQPLSEIPIDVMEAMLPPDDVLTMAVAYARVIHPTTHYPSRIPHRSVMIQKVRVRMKKVKTMVMMMTIQILSGWMRATTNQAAEMRHFRIKAEPQNPTRAQVCAAQPKQPSCFFI
jgi:hypothetical protein